VSIRENMDYRHIIIGGGAYGCFAALRLAEQFGGNSVLIVEQESDIMLRASYNNQARVHNGYHYPRSLLTALRSRINAPRFIAEFPDAIFSDFEQYYAISHRSNVTARQFAQFCQRVGADLRPAPARITKLFNDDLTEAVFSVTEYAFDSQRLRESLRSRIEAMGVKVLTQTEATKVSLEGVASSEPEFRLEVRNVLSDERQNLRCRYLFNCTYSRLNQILSRSGLETVRLKHEATEIAVVELPPSLRDLSITVMCGPFFSVMPFPPLKSATLSHVSYTPHYEWIDDPEHDGYAGHSPSFPLSTRFDRMRLDAARYVPALRECRYLQSLWEVKTILPQSGANDSRPILFKRDSSAPNLISLLGGKIDNIFDLDEALPRSGDDGEEVIGQDLTKAQLRMDNRGRGR
jgi:glycine/D-amino acid oxidase-like deaminating enzyme